MSKDNKLYDVRVVGQYIKEGIISKKDYESYIKKLTDVKDKSEVLAIEDENIENTEENQSDESG